MQKATGRPVGRPASAEPNGLARTAILDAAEQVFGTQGFDGGSMREIAQLAGIAQSLLHYHYDNKLSLYEAVFERRAKVILQVRKDKLDGLFDSRSDVSLEQVLDILFMPLERLIDEDRDKLRYYVQMLAGVTISGHERSIEIVRRFYDPSAEEFIAAFEKVLPRLTRERAVWAYLFAIGARMQAHAPNNRALRLGANPDTRRPYKLLVDFVAAGIRAICTE
ncbi:TetR/AcrR family transcriptional regulator [Methylobacterium sp. WSM2598]|uniref:TetR/AcrR family transcriptional regulator n=1 Tax=Methylobacterium sp. WSM2598 TaxID=398261 RepID=UPI0007C8632D|nr:TetR/AcrR family transcriptional regulator [Methylobacterium sp. WSM2598]